MPNKTAIGFIGLGQMGGSMAGRLLADDVALPIHDPSPAATSRFVTRGAIAHASPRQVADAAAIVFARLR
ncbi:NAD(P)-binding domain-containing protein [Caballeronia sp. LZ035]|uniref:NAD(P)-binding domain-containing protein n=1 Tax=Caballeronia sp. LZ035 TaxID=3038568 RepID=UPI0028562891|nr:NAD(P)-binding domain-containing protein [Caballeronia sp. LZ035]MDR5758960.1 NAD(P)-binding domain-containing protein [Caballeronia sp. LZ035]